MTVEENHSDTDVVICGCGPTGAMLAGYLGRMNVGCIMLEKESEIVTDPRGIALDEDGIRLLQGLGLYDRIYTEIGTCMGKFNFITGVTNDLMKPPFTVMDYSTSEGGTGHVGFICHKQPSLERSLRDVLDAHPTVDVRLGCTVIGVTEDKNKVNVAYKDGAGNVRTVSAKYLASADGKTGYTRKSYLEPKGVLLESTTLKYQETWVALNWKITLPTPETHPNFPLWERGYTPEQVYDLFFPEQFRFLCNPQRPAVCGRFGLQSDRLWRFEFVVCKHEDPTEMSSPAKIKSVVFPYITHAGKRYGVSEDVQFPEDCIKVLRCRPFGFAARSCNKWALGRVVLCGDAAHVFPPFGGQGIASGFRDASALAWRLAVACRPDFKGHEAFFESWYSERKQQLERSLNATVENGYFVTEGNPVKVFTRDWAYWAVQKIPRVRRWLEQGQRRYGMTRYIYQEGMTFIPGAGSGVLLPQIYCAPLGAMYSGQKIAFTDDVIFTPTKKGLFQLVVLVDRLEDIENARQALQEIEVLSGGELLPEEASYLLHDSKERAIVKDINVVRIATAQEFALSPLCRDRPEPHYYDEYRLRREVQGRKYLIVRPDRFVYAACSTKQELDGAAAKLRHHLAGI
jgi:2-polyprenyl-6-methoxyphenol hydroxylase-like FAD-dependent oxidoreductase